MDQASLHDMACGTLLWLIGMALILGAVALLAYEDWYWLENGHWLGVQLQDLSDRTAVGSSWQGIGEIIQWIAELPASVVGLIVGVVFVRAGGDLSDGG